MRRESEERERNEERDKEKVTKFHTSLNIVQIGFLHFPRVDPVISYFCTDGGDSPNFSDLDPPGLELGTPGQKANALPLSHAAAM